MPGFLDDLFGKVGANVDAGQLLQDALGQRKATDAIFGARAGKPDQSQLVEQVLGQQSPEQLAGVSRYLQGRDLGEDMTFPLATLANAVYTGDKALSQALGRERRILPITDAGQWGTPEKFDETTSPASLSNFLTAEKGMWDQSTLKKLWDSLKDKLENRDKGPSAPSFIRG